MRTETAKFQNADGETLAARVDYPDGAVKAWALFAHCFTCSKDIVGAREISRALARRGVAVFRFDFTGLGQSEGEFSDTTFSTNVADLLAAVDHMRGSFEAPQILIGHSLGGAAVLSAAGRVPEAKAVATIAAPSNAAHVAENFADKTDVVKREGEAVVDLGGRPFTIKKSFLDDLKTHAVLDEVAAMKKALLVMHAPLDGTVGISNATDIFLAAKHPKSFVSLDDADHLLTRKADADYAGGVLAAWAARFIDAAAPKPADDPDDADNDAAADDDAAWAVSRSVEGRVYTQDVRVQGHAMTIDADGEDGGDARGPNPTRVLHAALAACGSITAQMYARRKEIDLKSVEVAIRAAPGDDPHVNKTLKKRIRLEGDLTDAQRQRIGEIIDKCPVHRMVTEGVVVEREDDD